MSKKILLSGAILLGFFTLSVAAAVGEPTPTVADQTLMRYMVNSRFSDDPLVSISCFGYYIPILNNITEELSTSFQKCSVNENDRIQKLDEDAYADRYQIELAADNVCVRQDACNNYNNTLDFLDCFSGQGSDNTKSLYKITQNAIEKGGELREQYRLAKIDRIKCQNASERAYVEDTAKCYKQLDLCLQSGDLPSTTSPQTTYTSAQETTTSIAEDTSTTANASDVTTAEPTQLKEFANGRGLKGLSALRRFWS